MNTKPLIVATSLVGLLVAGVAIYVALAGGKSNQPDVFVDGISLTEALEQSKDSGDLVLVLALASWCQYCNTLDKDALSDDSVREAIQELTVPVRFSISASRIDPDAFPEIERLNVQSVPTLVLFDPNGRELGRIAGLVEAGELEAWIRSRGEVKPSKTGGAGKLGRKRG